MEDVVVVCTYSDGQAARVHFQATVVSEFTTQGLTFQVVRLQREPDLVITEYQVAYNSLCCRPAELDEFDEPDYSDFLTKAAIRGKNVEADIKDFAARAATLPERFPGLD